jgi:ketosteroid isomerase-like protein
VSQTNIAIIRTMYEAFNRGDIADARQLLHPAAELHQPGSVADASVYHGRDEFARGLTLWTSAWEQPRFELLDARGIGDNVLLRIRAAGRGRTSGIETGTEFFHAWTLSDGKPHRCFVRDTEAEAVKALELGP